MVIDLGEEADKSTGPAKLTEEVMGIMCRWEELSSLGTFQLWLLSNIFGEGVFMLGLIWNFIVEEKFKDFLKPTPPEATKGLNILRRLSRDSRN